MKKELKVFIIVFLFFALLSGLVNGEGSGQDIRCSAIKKDSVQCRFSALTGSKFCYRHNPVNQCAGITKAGARCKGVKMKGSYFCFQHHTK